jgi:hypothetical protein
VRCIAAPLSLGMLLVAQTGRATPRTEKNRFAYKTALTGRTG